MLSERKYGGYFFKLCGLLVVMAALMLCSMPATAEDKEAISNAEGTACKELKPFNNLDELLYQFYINLDSDCLFEMPVAELEKIWGIKILSEGKATGREFFQLKMGSDFSAKPYKSEKDAFYIEIRRDTNTNARVFAIVITKNYQEKHATLFPDGNFPKLLPEPFKKSINLQTYTSPGGTGTAREPQNPGELAMKRYMYYWLNADQTRMIYLVGVDGVYEIIIRKHVLPGFTNKNVR